MKKLFCCFVATIVLLSSYNVSQSQQVDVKKSNGKKQRTVSNSTANTNSRQVNKKTATKSVNNVKSGMNGVKSVDRKIQNSLSASNKSNVSASRAVASKTVNKVDSSKIVIKATNNVKNSTINNKSNNVKGVIVNTGKGSNNVDKAKTNVKAQTKRVNDSSSVVSGKQLKRPDVKTSTNDTSGANVLKAKSGDLKNKQIVHVVVNGDNIYRISEKYKVSQNDIIKLNNISNNNIYAGQKLILPDYATINESDATSLGSTNGGENGDVNVGNGNVSNDSSVIVVNDNSNNKKNDINDGTQNAGNENLNKVVIVKNDNKTVTSLVDDVTFMFPVDGKIVVHFGHLTNNGRMEGVSIKTKAGSPVKASASGEVVYSNVIEGYNNVILIRHYNGFFTAYGYVEPLVSVGDKVKKKQISFNYKQDAWKSLNTKLKNLQLVITLRKNR